MIRRSLIFSCLFLVFIHCVVSASDAERAFERLKKLQGVWHGSSTKGWTDTDTIRVIARGSAILSTSQFVDEPSEGMATVFVMENGKLLMTHYCEAGNQPVLQAQTIENDGSKITFEFKGGTNLPSRNVGHMDSVTFQFEDENHFSSQWSWYANGQQKLFETIHYERK